MAIKSVTADTLTEQAQAKASRTPPQAPVDGSPAVDAPKDDSGKGLRKQLETLLEEKRQLEEFAQSEYELRVKAEAAAKYAPPKAQAPAEAPKTDEAPDPDDAKYAGNPKSFLADRDAWNRREALREFEKSQSEKAKQAETERAVAEIESRRVASLAAARETFADFDDAIKSADVKQRMGQIPGPPPHIQAAVAESEYMAHLVYHFATNPEEAKKIFEMSPSKAALALGRLETRFEKKASPAPEAKPVIPPTVSKAPPPIANLSGGSGVIATSSAEATSFHDYKRLRMEEMKRRGRR